MTRIEIAKSLKSKPNVETFWKAYLFKSCNGFDSESQQMLMTDFGDSLLKKRDRGIQLFNSLI